MKTNKTKRLFAGIIAAAMMSVCIPATVSQAAGDDGNGIYVLKWGDNSGTMTGNFNYFGTDGDTFVRIDTATTGDTPAAESTISYGFNYTGEETTGYDVWVLATLNKYDALSRPNISFDGGAKTAIPNEFNGWINAGQTADTVAADGVVSPRNYPLAWTGFSLNWCKVAENVTFKKGEHTLDYTVYPRSDGAVLTCYGGAILVPSSYNWVPTSNTDVKASGSTYETSFDHSYAWIELEDYNTTDGDGGARSIDTGNANLSNHGVLRMYVRPNEETYTYDFTLDNSGSYDIWYLGNENLGHLSWFDYGIDVSDTDPLTPAGCLASSDTVYTYNLDIDLNVKWHKAAANVNISSGHHVLTFQEKYRSVSANLFGVSDCIAIVPSDVAWTPAATDKADAGRANLDATVLESVLNKKYENGAAENIYMPQMGAAGSRYSYITADDTIIAEDGTINRTSEDQFGGIGVTATVNNTASNMKQIYITVLAKETLEVTDFVIKNSAGETPSSLTGSDTITASANVLDSAANAKGAVIILALYNANNVLRKVEKGTIAQLTSTAQPISASMTLPSDVTGMYVKAFLWDDMNAMVPLAGCIDAGR